MQFIFYLTLWLSLVLSGCKPRVPPNVVPDEPIQDTTVLIADPIVEPEPMTNYEIARLSIGQPPVDSINHWLAFVGLPPNNPFCSAANCAWNDYVGLWHPNSGLARHWKTMQTGGMWVSAERVLAGGEVIPAGSIVVWEKVNTIFGHVGIVTRDFTGEGGMYVSANTSPPNSSGSEYSGGGVYEKEFLILPWANFKVTGFITFQT